MKQRLSDSIDAAGKRHPGAIEDYRMFRDETWRPIPGYEGLYEVSSFGRVWSQHTHRLKAVYRGARYPIITLHNKGMKTHTLHSLVMLAFVGPPPEGMQTRHLDGNAENNRLDNLAYGTCSENNLDKVRHGTHRNSRKTHCPQGHPYDEANTYVHPRFGRRCRACGRARKAAKKAAS